MCDENEEKQLKIIPHFDILIFKSIQTLKNGDLFFLVSFKRVCVYTVYVSTDHISLKLRKCSIVMSCSQQ